MDRNGQEPTGQKKEAASVAGGYRRGLRITQIGRRVLSILRSIQAEQDEPGVMLADGRRMMGGWMDCDSPEP